MERHRSKHEPAINDELSSQTVPALRIEWRRQIPQPPSRQGGHVSPVPFLARDAPPESPQCAELKISGQMWDQHSPSTIRELFLKHFELPRPPPPIGIAAATLHCRTNSRLRSAAPFLK